MHINDEPFEAFFTWIKSFKPHLLRNEAEVKTAFIIPLLTSLGYPNQCCRHEYPVDIYDTAGKPLKKLYIDQICFSTDDAAEQTADTSLVIAEVKRPGEPIERALHQARLYGYYLSPVFLLITDGKLLRIIKRHSHRGEETVFDHPITSLQSRPTAQQLYHDLHFKVVQQIKTHLADTVMHTLYVDLMHALQEHPNLRTELATQGFQRTRKWQGRRLTVVEPKVSLTCDIPLAFGESECHIHFHNLLLRALTCHLTHQQILKELLLGLGTEPHWGARPFLRQKENGSFEAHLGQTTALLSGQEAKDLCVCIDEVGSAYKAAVITAEETLETWNYQPITLHDFRSQGFLLRSVPFWLWQLMLRFAHEHDRLSGDSSWHLFDAANAHLKIIHDYMEEAALIYPLFHLTPQDVGLIYCVDEDESLADQMQRKGRRWQQSVGPHGRWTARYTERWLAQQFIPHVFTYYCERGAVDATQVLPWKASAPITDPLPPVAQVNHPKGLIPYIHQIQSWLLRYPERRHLSATLLRRYYAALTDVVRNWDDSLLEAGHIAYCRKHLLAAEICLREERNEGKKKERSDDVFAGRSKGDQRQQVTVLIGKLDEHVHRICAVEHENPRIAQYLTCVFIAFLQEGRLRSEQEPLNEAKEAVAPLVELSRFEERYVL